MSRPVLETTPALDRVLARLPQRDELVVALEVGEVEARPSSATVSSAASRAHSSSARRAPAARAARRPVEAADAHVDRVDLAAADDASSARCRSSSAAARVSTRSRRVARQLDRAVEAEEVGRVEHVDVQRVALDPLAAVEEPPQRLRSARDARRRRASSIALHELIWYATGQMPQMRAVMSGASVNCAAAQERLEEARRLEDPAARTSSTSPSRDADDMRALALDPGEVVGPDLARAQLLVLASRKAARRVEGRRRAQTSSSAPSARQLAASAAMFGVSIGPKQP